MNIKYTIMVICMVFVFQTAFSQEGEENEHIYPPYSPAEEFKEVLDSTVLSDLQLICRAFVKAVNKRNSYDDLSRILPAKEGFEDYEPFIAEMTRSDITEENLRYYQSLVEYNRTLWVRMIEGVEDQNLEFLDVGLCREEESIWYLSIIINSVNSRAVEGFPVLAVIKEGAVKIMVLNELPFEFSS